MRGTDDTLTVMGGRLPLSQRVGGGEQDGGIERHIMFDGDAALAGPVHPVPFALIAVSHPPKDMSGIYEGSVNCEPSDDSATDADEVWSDDESLAELEGDELEANLSYDESQEFKDWKKIEANRALGYTKGSTRTQARRRKEAQEREASQAEAKTS
ncbi:hypothetical protein JB92DRAFT_3133717 [Gautieria morchelliformis]|nr:hypothetical protein JB92DRAFT_3133717 [Gautieria morchelliformis]